MRFPLTAGGGCLCGRRAPLEGLARGPDQIFLGEFLRLAGHLRVLVLEGADHRKHRAARPAALVFDVKGKLEETRAQICFISDLRRLPKGPKQGFEFRFVSHRRGCRRTALQCGALACMFERRIRSRLCSGIVSEARLEIVRKVAQSDRSQAA